VSAWLPLAAPRGTPGRPGRQRAVQRVRSAAYEAAMRAAEWVNDRANNTAIRANKVYGWLARRRDRR